MTAVDQTVEQLRVAQVTACAVQLRAERRAGELLAGMEKNRGAEGNPGGQGASVVRSHYETAQPLTLADMGITKGQSSRWQQLANVPQVQFEAALADPEAMPSMTRLSPSG